MIDNFNAKPRYNINDLIEIIRLLRSPQGCPWDAVQNHESIKKNFIEETYEVIEAINKKDTSSLKEELGDVLLQVVFHSIFEEEKNNFNFDDVCDGICKKIVSRHTHVFGDVKANSPESALNNWDEIKKIEKGQTTQTETMLSVPRELPALMRAEKIQKKAANIGFDWDDYGGAYDKLSEELSELKIAIESKQQSQVSEEFGDLLFSMVNLSRFLRLDAEEALTFANDKFIERFATVEKLAEERGVDIKNSSLKELDKLWDEAKLILKSN